MALVILVWSGHGHDRSVLVDGVVLHVRVVYNHALERVGQDLLDVFDLDGLRRS